jgi:hypothetical protein
MQNLENEEWRDVPGYEGLYQVSDMGRVKSLPKEWVAGKGVVRKHDGKILKPKINEKGYLKITFCNNGKMKYFEMQQIVAMAFLNHIPCGHKVIVDHRDENPSNNKLENLQLLTQRGNTLRIKKGKGYSSDFKGVCWHKQMSKWHSRIEINKKTVSLGLFTEEKHASKAYQLAVANLDKYDGDNKKFRKFIKSLM